MSIRPMTIKGSETITANADSMLLRQDGKMCCWGIYARFKGVKDAEITDVGSLTNCGLYTLNDQKEAADRVVRKEHPTFMGSYTANDDTETTDAQKISILRKVFRVLGVVIVWRPNL